MNKIMTTILIIAALAGTGTVQGTTITFSSGHYTWTDSDPYYDEVFVENDAILYFTGGEVGKLEGRDNCSINITGGILSQLWVGDHAVANILECDQLEILEARPS